MGKMVKNGEKMSLGIAIFHTKISSFVVIRLDFFRF